MISIFLFWGFQTGGGTWLCFDPFFFIAWMHEMGWDEDECGMNMGVKEQEILNFCTIHTHTHTHTLMENGIHYVFFFFFFLISTSKLRSACWLSVLYV